MQQNPDFAKIIEYMKNHWPSQVKPEWQVSPTEYPALVKRALADFTADATKNRHLFRIAGISGSGKTTQILPAVETYCAKNNLRPILVAARRFVEYHPYYQEIKDFYGDENLRQMTDEFNTIMFFMTLAELLKNGYDIILDVTLLDPQIESILLKFLDGSGYQMLILMIAVSPAVTEKYLSGRDWRHSKKTELEFVRATSEALSFYAKNASEIRIILWSFYDELPIYDGPVKDCIDIFNDYSTREDLPKNDDDVRRDAKISYLLEH